MSQSYKGISPRSECYLIHDCPLEIENCNQIDFISETQQFGWFKGEGSSPCSYTKLDSVQFIRKETGSIKVPYALTELRGVNYLVFQNPSGGSPTSGFDGKRYYCYVLDKLYVNQNVTKIIFAIDYFQTYLFDWKFKTCFIERETVESDKIGEHRIEEALGGMGDCYKAISSEGGIFNSNDVNCVILTTVEWEYSEGQDEYYPVQAPYSIGGVYSGAKPISFNSPKDASNYIKKLCDGGYSDAIIGMYMSPVGVSTRPDWTYFTRENGLTYGDVSLADFKFGYFSNTANGAHYECVNNKLKAPPYQCLHVSTNSESQDFDPTQFQDKYHIRFREFGINGGCFSGMLVPLNYSGEVVAYSRQMNLGTFPTCSWTNDAYQALVANKFRADIFSLTNGKTGEISQLTNAVVRSKQKKSIQDEYTGKMERLRGMLGGDTYLKQLKAGYSESDLEEMYRRNAKEYAKERDEALAKWEEGPDNIQGLEDLSKEIWTTAIADADCWSDIYPPDYHGSVNVDVMYAINQLKPRFWKRSIDADKAKSIDMYFTMYGYKVSKFGVPNLRSRKLFNYVQMSECHIAKKAGAIMEKDAEEKVKALFLSGLRIWHYNTNRGLADFNIINADENPIDHNESSKARDYNN